MKRHFAMLCVAAAALGVLVAQPASASAATIGQTTASANYPCVAEIDIQPEVAFGTSFVVPAGSWLLTSWSTFAGSTGGSMGLMIFRAVAGFPGGLLTTVVAESPVQTLTPGVLNTFPTNVVVHGGDFLGFWSGNGAACATFTGVPADVNLYSFGPEPVVGATVPLFVALGFVLNISATISSPADLLADLLVAVTGKGPGTSLADKVARIQSYVAANDITDACATLNDFTNEVKAQAGKQITASEAASFTTQANTIRAVLGC
jgi:hypothetical protein